MRLFLLTLLTLCACETATVDGALAPEETDYARLRFSAEASDRDAFAALAADADALQAEINAGLGSATPVTLTPDRCSADTIARSHRAPWVRLAEAAPDYASGIEDAAAVRERVARVTVLADALASDAGPPEALSNAWRTWDLADTRTAMLAAGDPRVRELLRRKIRDQVFRIVAYGDLAAPYLEGLSERARELWPRLITARLAEIDCANTAWLRAQIAEHGWFDIPTYGEDADDAAWLMVQHADRTPAFQGEMLALLESLPDGATDPVHRAYLWDRVAVKEGRPQRYGTQLQCDDGEVRAMGGVEDGVEERRAALGMQSFADYRAVMTRMTGCGA